MKKLLFFIPSLDGGGAEKVLVNLVNNLDKKIFSVTVQTLFDCGENRKYLDPSVQYKYVFKHIFRGNIHLFKLFSPKQLYRYMVKEEYDIVISYLQGPTTRIVSGCDNKDTLLVNWIHNEFHERYKITKCYRSDKEAVICNRRYAATVFVANSAKIAYEKVFSELMTNNFVLYNTIESDLIKEKSIEIVPDMSSDNIIKLISVGRFVPQKAFDRLIRICARLIHEDGLNINLYLLGQGPLLGECKKIANQEKIKEQVLFLGYQENPYKYVKNSDLFVCSSLQEGFSTAVTESLIVGTPVITTMCSGMEELLGSNEEYGVIVDNDENALYERIKQIITTENELYELSERAKLRGSYFNKDYLLKETEKFLINLSESTNVC